MWNTCTNLLLFGLVLSVLCAGFARAAVGDDQRQECRDLIADFTQKLEEAKAPLMAGITTDEQLERYLFNALWLVYESKLYATIGLDEDAERTNTDLPAVVEMGILQSWPGNPLNNWEPMRVLAPTDGFSAGDLCLSVCPESYGTTHRGKKRRVSFDLFIYGPVEAYTGPNVNKFPGDNGEWDHAPAGALYRLSYWVNSDKYRAASKAEWQRRQQEKL